MAPFSDRQLEQLFIQYNDRERDRVFIYHGSQDVIIKELKAWVLRRKEVFAEQKRLLNISERRIEGMLSSEVKTPEPEHLDLVLRRRARRLVGKAERTFLRRLLNLEFTGPRRRGHPGFRKSSVRSRHPQMPRHHLAKTLVAS